MPANNPKRRGRKQPPQSKRSSIEVDVESLLRLENTCNGCGRDDTCCCSSYEVCVTASEMRRIIRYLPEASRFCPHLATLSGYDNVFEEEEHGLYSLDTDEDGLCLFAYWKDNRTHCSLHTVAVTLGLPLGEVKPRVCLLWPLHVSDDDDVLALISDASRFRCNTRKRPGSRILSPGFVDALEQVYGEGCGEQVSRAAASGERRTLLIPRW